MSKPPLPAARFLDWPRVPVDEDSGGLAALVRIGGAAAANWKLGPNGPYQTPQTPIQTMNGEIREALLHLLELGFIEVDEERLAAARFFPLRRDDARPTAPPAFAGARA